MQRRLKDPYAVGPEVNKATCIGIGPSTIQEKKKEKTDQILHSYLAMSWVSQSQDQKIK